MACSQQFLMFFFEREGVGGKGVVEVAQSEREDWNWHGWKAKVDNADLASPDWSSLIFALLGPLALHPYRAWCNHWCWMFEGTQNWP